MANQNVAVFSGAECANVPTGVRACDHLISQNFSVDNFDTDYKIAKNFGGGSDGDIVRVLAAEDNTEVFINGVSAGVINAGEFIERDGMSDAGITTTKPVQVAQFVRGQAGARTTGDPAFAIVPSVNQWLDAYAYATPVDDEAFGGNYLNIAIKVADSGSLTLNGASVDTSGFALLDGYLFGNVAIDPGFGMVSADNPFLAMVAGFNDYDSYFSAIATSFSEGASPPVEPTSPVPLPAGVWLSLGGLAALAGLRRKSA